MAPEPFAAAAAQITATSDLPANLRTCAELAGRAAEEGAALLLLPENFAFLGRREHDKLAVAETLDSDTPGPILSAVLAMAQSHQLWVVAGGIPEKLPARAPSDELTHTYNTCLVVSPSGKITSRYRKIHLFDVDIPGLARICESDNTMAGSETVVADTPLARFGLSICYDLRFPELYRDLILRGGAEVLLLPSAFTAHTGKAHWHTLLRSRAIENQCYVIAANQTGHHNDRRESYGHSQIIDPWGTIVAEIEEGVGLAIGEINPEILTETRRKMPCLEHRVL